MANVIAADSSAAPRTNLGTWTILIVSVAMLTVMAISVPHLIGRDGWATGEKLLYLALIGYLGASALHVFSLVTRQSGLLRAAEALTRASLFLHTAAIVTRWVESGHAPLSSIYEMVLVFSWAVVVLHEVAEWKLELPFLGAITLPIATLAHHSLAGAAGGDQASGSRAAEHLAANSRYAGDAELRGLHDLFCPSFVVSHQGRGQRAHFPHLDFGTGGGDLRGDRHRPRWTVIWPSCSPPGMRRLRRR